VLYSSVSSPIRVSLSLLSRACCQPGGSLHELCCQMPSYAAHLRPAGTISGGDRRCVSSSRCCTAVSVHLSESVSHTLASSLTGHLSATHLSLTSHTHARTQTLSPSLACHLPATYLTHTHPFALSPPVIPHSIVWMPLPASHSTLMLPIGLREAVYRELDASRKAFVSVP
jgi:hypothetical protein